MRLRAATVLAIVLAFGLAVAACHPRPMPLLGVGPLRRDDPTLFDDALAAVRESGHLPISTDPEHGRFTVRANTDVARQTVFVVQCSRDGFVTVTPQGGRVLRRGETFDVPRVVREEWRDIILAIERGVAEVADAR